MVCTKPPLSTQQVYIVGHIGILMDLNRILKQLKLIETWLEPYEIYPDFSKLNTTIVNTQIKKQKDNLSGRS